VRNKKDYAIVNSTLKTNNTYIAILRGINVSGQNIIKMEVLRRMMEGLGFQEVSTYIQSGNVVFRKENASTTEVLEEITEKMQEEFGFHVPVIVLEAEALDRIIAGNPFAMDPALDKGQMHVTFLASAPPAFDREAIEAKKQDSERIAFSEHAVYLYCPNGYGRTKLSNDFLEKKMKVTATTRNWRTVCILMEKARG
jgi:uncharacterized protein (DUF1697 family)